MFSPILQYPSNTLIQGVVAAAPASSASSVISVPSVSSGGWYACGVFAALFIIVSILLLRSRRGRSECNITLEQIRASLRPFSNRDSREHTTPAQIVQAAQDAALQLITTKSKLESLEHTLNFSPLPILMIGEDRRVLTANAAAQQLFAGGRVLIGRTVEETLTQAEAIRLYEHASGGTQREHNITLLTPAGHTRTLSFTAQPLPKAPGQTVTTRPVVITLHDITELAQADRLRTDFVANASHELRTPLSSIKAAIETLADGAWDDHSMREKLAAMTVTNIGRLETILRDLLDLSRLEDSDSTPPDTSRLQNVDLPAFLHAIADGFAPLLTQRRLTVRIDTDRAPGVWCTDPRLLELIVRNLIDNSTKFAFEGTCITLRATLVPQQTGNPTEDERALIIKVEDKGIGIPIEHQPRIFERFFQVDSARAGATNAAQRRGTGLGLAIVSHASRQLGGNISVESVWKQGTTMIVTLPMITPAG